VASANGHLDQSQALGVRVGDRGPLVNHVGQLRHGNVQVHPQLAVSGTVLQPVATVASSLRSSDYYTQSLHGAQSDSGSACQYPSIGVDGKYENSDRGGAQGRPAGRSNRSGIRAPRHQGDGRGHGDSHPDTEAQQVGGINQQHGHFGGQQVPTGGYRMGGYAPMGGGVQEAWGCNVAGGG